MKNEQKPTSKEPLKIPENLTFANYGDFTAAASSYTDKSDPAGILRRGVVEETKELVEALTEWIETDYGDYENAKKEIGDLLYYMQENARHNKTSLDEVVFNKLGAHMTLDEFQDATNDIEAPLPIYHDGTTVPKDAYNIELYVSAVRIIDSLNPKNNPELWESIPERPDTVTLIYDLLIRTAKVATKLDIRLQNAAEKALTENHNRTRKPHVVQAAMAAPENTHLSSQRREITEDELYLQWMGRIGARAISVIQGSTQK